MEDPRYPIGPFTFDGKATPRLREYWIAEIAAAPGALRAAISGLTPVQLDHLPDSHMNAYTRIKLALTEDEPVIKPYDESRWAQLPDVQSTPVETSITLLDCLHRRWVLLLRQLTPAEFGRRFRHPQHGRSIDIDELLAMYAWHGRHHVAQITSLRTRMGWG
jgi:hypothetical protein